MEDNNCRILSIQDKMKKKMIYTLLRSKNNSLISILNACDIKV
jgi:hypothetical protein